MNIIRKKKKHSAVGKIIKQLMQESNMSEAELARQVGLPQTTVNRLLLGSTADPRASTLKPIAKFFDITIDQLLGIEDIPQDRISGTFRTINRDAWTHVPIIEWKDAIAWLFRNDDYDLHSHQQWTVSDCAISKQSFALPSTPSMEPMFRRNSILIIDPDADIVDGKYVILTLDGSNTVIRKAHIDGGCIYLKNFDQHLPTIKLETNIHRVLGVVIEAKVNF